MFTAAPLQPKSSGPLSQLTEPVSCHPRSLLEPGWAGEGLSTCPPLGLLLTREAEVVGVGELSLSTSPHPPTPASICFHNTLQCCAWTEGELPQRTKFPQTTHLGHQAAHGVGFPQASSPSTLTLTSLRANDTLSALQPKEGTPMVPAAGPPPHRPLNSWLSTAGCSTPSLRPPGDCSGPGPC